MSKAFHCEPRPSELNALVLSTHAVTRSCHGVRRMLQSQQRMTSRGVTSPLHGHSVIKRGRARVLARVTQTHVIAGRRAFDDADSWGMIRTMAHQRSNHLRERFYLELLMRLGLPAESLPDQNDRAGCPAFARFAA